MARRERAEAGGHREALERQERAAVAAVAVVDARAGERGVDRLLGVALQRVRIGGERGSGERGDEARPQRARVADEQAEPRPGGEIGRIGGIVRVGWRSGELLEAGLARGRARVEGVREIEAGLGEPRERWVHAGTMPRHARPGILSPVPARLHHERIARGGAAPATWLLLTHGIYGAGGNWRAIARKLVEARPDWGVVLVDLRQHGRSEAGEPPHTLDAAAEDLRALAAELGGIDALAGHSFGGKVVLAARARAPVRQTWMLDASPSARPGALADRSNSVIAVLELMERLPRAWARREDFVAAVTAAGHALPLAQWLAMNLVAADGGGLTLRLELAALREMLADYFARDLWAEAFAPGGGALEVVIADRSSALSVDDRARLERAPAHVRAHHVDAGHWLHIEAQAAVIDLFAAHLPRAGDS